MSQAPPWPTPHEQRVLLSFLAQADLAQGHSLTLCVGCPTRMAARDDAPFVPCPECRSVLVHPGGRA